MILEFDLGNSLSKWRLLDAGKVEARGRFTDVDALSIPARSVSRVRVASVVVREREDSLAAWCEQELGVLPEFARSVERCSGVVNGYSDPGRLGVDRWLAVMAAFREFPQGALVIDAGTAITIDFVSASGRHSGGYILPGLRLSQTVLQQDTSNIRLDQEVGPMLEPGISTSAAVVNGSLFAARATLRAARDYARQQVGSDCACVMTGGDAELLLKFLGDGSDGFVFRPDLVYDGLALALP